MSDTHPFAQHVGSIAISATHVQPDVLGIAQIFTSGGLAQQAPAYLEPGHEPVPPGTAVRITRLSGLSGVYVAPLENL